MAGYQRRTVHVAVHDAQVFLYLAADPPDRFLTLSLWPDWSAIERATGGDVHRPMSTKDSARIVDMDIVHYEVVTDAT